MRISTTGTLAAVCVLLGCGAFTVEGASAEKIYWSDTGTPKKIQRANFDGSLVEDAIDEGLGQPTAIALDTAGGSMYLTDSQNGRILRADLDDPNVVAVLVAGLEEPWGIALDLTGGKMYWTDVSGRRIQRANLDGTGDIEDLVTQDDGLTEPRGIALALACGKMYWGDVGKIQCANLNGTEVQDCITGLGAGVNGLALDLAGAMVYWTLTDGPGGNRIQRSDMDCSDNPEDLVAGGVVRPRAIALDVGDRKMYWAEKGTARIRRANMEIPEGEDPNTRTDVEDLVTADDGLIYPYGLALDLRRRPRCGDLNGDGAVNIQDLAELLAHYGETCP